MLWLFHFIFIIAWIMKKLSPPITIPEKAIFKGFDIEQPWHVPKYYGNLPHLRLQGATYFVTFRLADSIPKTVAENWLKWRNQWLSFHGIDPNLAKSNPKLWNELYLALPSVKRYEFELAQRRHYFIELDKCHGSCLLSQAHKIVSEAVDFFHGKSIWCGDYVIMPNHVHLLVQPFPGVKLEEWLYSIKRFSSKEICKAYSHSIQNSTLQGHFWQRESYDRIVRSREELARMRRYIKNNPEKLRIGTFTLKQMDWLNV